MKAIAEMKSDTIYIYIYIYICKKQPHKSVKMAITKNNKVLYIEINIKTNKKWNENKIEQRKEI